MEVVSMFAFAKEKGNTINKYQYYLLIKFYINGYYMLPFRDYKHLVIFFSLELCEIPVNLFCFVTDRTHAY